MADQLTFFNNAHANVFDKVTGQDNGRAVATINLTLRDDLTGETAGPAPLRLHLMGPADVSGLQESAIVHTAPKPWSRDNETTKLAHVDLAEIDVPWRYSFELQPRPKPWIVLITGTSDELELAAGMVKIKDNAVLAAHDLNDSPLWAHVQNANGRQVARLISPRGMTHNEKGLEPNREYIAALVPAYLPAGAGVKPAWVVTNGAVTTPPDGSVLPAYYAWHYWTAEAGDFRTLAAQLHAVDVGGLGRSKLNYDRTDPAVELEIRGAITSLATTADTPTARIHGQNTTWPPDTQPAPADVLADLDALHQPLVAPRGPVIGLPVYGTPWIAAPDDTDWGRLLNSDPRFRGIAGLGAWLAIEAQEELIDEARKQVGALAEASQRVRQLAMGLRAARSLWGRRLPTDPVQQLWLFGPTLRRIPVAGNAGVSAMDVVTGGDRTLPRAMLSSAARRLLRPNDGITKHARPGAAGRNELINAANQCPPPPSPPGIHVDGLLGALGLRGLGEMLGLRNMPDKVREAIKEIVAAGQPINSDAVAERLFAALQNSLGVPFVVFQRLRDRLRPYNQTLVTEPLLEDIVRPFLGDIGELNPEQVDAVVAVGDDLGQKPERPCRPVDLIGLGQKVGAAISPLGDQAPVLVRICATVTGIDICNLEPPEVCIGLNYEVWKLLRDKAKSWLLPGIEDLEKSAVVAMESNPAFVDALLVGLNTQLLGELHWRNIAVAAKCTPLRWFWGFYDYKNGKRTDDIRGIDLWQDTRLGDNQHQVLRFGDVSGNRDLVLVFRTDLFRRYPSTLVYLSPSNDDNALKSDQPDFSPGHALGPKVKGIVSDDVTFFIFDVKPEELPNYYVVLDEPPHELRFRNDNGIDGTDGSHFGQRAIDKPTRVAIDGKYLDFKGLPQ
jgi:hypothetical protein